MSPPTSWGWSTLFLAVFTVRFWGPFILAQHAKFNPGGSLTLTSGIYWFLNSGHRTHKYINWNAGVIGLKPWKGSHLAAGMLTSLNGLVRGLAVDLAPVRVNLVNPGPVNNLCFKLSPTSFWKLIHSSIRLTQRCVLNIQCYCHPVWHDLVHQIFDALFGDQRKGAVEGLAEKTLLKRVGEPNEVRLHVNLYWTPLMNLYHLHRLLRLISFWWSKICCRTRITIEQSILTFVYLKMWLYYWPTNWCWRRRCTSISFIDR